MQFHEIEPHFLKPQVNDAAWVCDDAVELENKQGRQVRTLQAPTVLLNDEVYMHEQKESTGCKISVVLCEAADTKSNLND